MSLFRTKDIAKLLQESQENGLNRNLGALDLLLLGIGCIIGTGIFVLTGIAAVLASAHTTDQ
jgi:APA family basic amino acid/polyamine antiporter